MAWIERGIEFYRSDLELREQSIGDVTARGRSPDCGLTPSLLAYADADSPNTFSSYPRLHAALQLASISCPGALALCWEDERRLQPAIPPIGQLHVQAAPFQSSVSELFRTSIWVSPEHNGKGLLAAMPSVTRVRSTSGRISILILAVATVTVCPGRSKCPLKLQKAGNPKGVALE